MKLLIIGIKSFCKILSDHLFPAQSNWKLPGFTEGLLAGKSHAGLASMNLGKLEYGVSTEEQLLEVLGDNNKEEEEDAEELEATLVECRVTLDMADYNYNADNARLNNWDNINGNSGKED